MIKPYLMSLWRWIASDLPYPPQAKLAAVPIALPLNAGAPAPTLELPVSILDKLSLFSKLAPIVTTAVQVVEVVAPNSTGVQKLEKAKAGITAAVEKAADIKQSASDLWDVIEPLIELVVAALKTAPAADATAVEAPKPS